MLEIGEIPIWFGAQLLNQKITAPFSFEVDDYGLIRMGNGDIAQKMIDNYQSKSYHFITSPPGYSPWGNELAMKSVQGLLDTFGDLKNKKILEIGGGTSWVAEVLITQLGASHVTVIDPALPENKDVHPNIDLISEYLTEDTKLSEKYDLIISFNTIEHVPEPIDFLRLLRKFMSDDCFLYLKLPESSESLNAGDWGICVHEHLTYFSKESMTVALEVAGFKPVAWSNYRGAIQVLSGLDSPASSKIAAGSNDLLEAFSLKSAINLENLKKQVNSYKKLGFYGASVGLCNVAHLAHNFFPDAPDIFDSDVAKVGRFIPGCADPIKDSSELKGHDLDAICIVPFNFSSVINNQLKLINRGIGRFDLTRG
ncbi:class I SAM-dependent methyltransferase [Paracoccaceae bacterium]|nr:class I SAM-dependent methyltransferase [Paracoccaceae bacterium]